MINQIALNPSMITKLSGDGDAGLLLSKTGEFWFPGWDNFPASAVIDLGKEYDVTGFTFIDEEGKGEIEFCHGMENAWIPFYKARTDKTNEDVAIRTQFKTRYVLVKILRAGGNISNMKIYADEEEKEIAKVQILIDGNPIGETTDISKLTFKNLVGTGGDPGDDPGDDPKDDPKDDDPIGGDGPIPVGKDLPFNKFAGLCSLPDDPYSKAKVSKKGYVRPYYLSKWALYDVQNVNAQDLANNPHKLEFGWENGYSGGWIHGGLKDYYDNGMDIIPSFKESFMFLTNNNKGDLDNKPRFLNENGNDPWSWRYIGIYFAQFAAKYGQTQVPVNKLLLKGDEPKTSGLGWVKALQGENEADKWWLGKDSEFTPEEWAAYHSVLYDGHMGEVSQRLGLMCGVKEADPKMLVYSGPLAHLSYEYLNRAVAWWEQNRNKPGYPKIPLDGFSFHRYSNSSGRQRDLNGVGISPEAFGFYEYSKEFVDWCEALGVKHNQSFDTLITEHGYDTNGGSPQTVQAPGGISNEVAQGQFLARTFLIHDAAGLSRSAMYMLRNVNDGGGGIFQTCGYTSTKGNGWQEKPSWYYMRTLTTVLEGFILHNIVQKNGEGIWDLEYKNPQTGKTARVFWKGSSNNSSQTYALNVGGTGTLVELIDGSQTGKQTPKIGDSQFTANEWPKVFIY